MTLNQIRDQVNAENSPIRNRGGAQPSMPFRVPMPPPPAPSVKSKIPAPTSRLPQPTRSTAVPRPAAAVQNKPSAAGAYQPLSSNPPVLSVPTAASAFSKPAIPTQIIIPLPEMELQRPPSACSGKSNASSVVSLPIGASASNLYAATSYAAPIPPPPSAYAGSTASSSSSTARSSDKNAAACTVNSTQQHQVTNGPAPYFDSGMGSSRLRPGEPYSVTTQSGPPSQHSGSGSGNNVPTQTFASSIGTSTLKF